MSKTNKNIFEIEIKASKKGLDEIFKGFLVYYLEEENLDIITNSNIQQNLNQKQ